MAHIVMGCSVPRSSRWMLCCPSVRMCASCCGSKAAVGAARGMGQDLGYQDQIWWSLFTTLHYGHLLSQFGREQVFLHDIGSTGAHQPKLVIQASNHSIGSNFWEAPTEVEAGGRQGPVRDGPQWHAGHFLVSKMCNISHGHLGFVGPTNLSRDPCNGTWGFRIGGIPVGSINGNMFGPTVTARAFVPTGWLAPTLLFLAKQWAGFPAHEGGGTATIGTGCWVWGKSCKILRVLSSFLL